MIIQGDSEHAIMATPRTSLVNCKRLKWSRDWAVQSVEGMARTLRLDLLARTNVAVGSDLLLTSWMVMYAAWFLSHFQAGRTDGKTAYVLGERVMWKDPISSLRSGEASWDTVCGGDDHRQAKITSSARKWASLWLARFDVSRRQNARMQVEWWP